MQPYGLLFRNGHCRLYHDATGHNCTPCSCFETVSRGRDTWHHQPTRTSVQWLNNKIKIRTCNASNLASDVSESSWRVKTERKNVKSTRKYNGKRCSRYLIIPLNLITLTTWFSCTANGAIMQFFFLESASPILPWRNWAQLHSPFLLLDNHSWTCMLAQSRNKGQAILEI